MFKAGQGIIELLNEGRQKKVEGGGISLEVKDVWKLFKRIKAKVVFSMRNNDWGDSSFCIRDPSGLEITFFTKTTH